jgi:hypothetical protein
MPLPFRETNSNEFAELRKKLLTTVESLAASFHPNFFYPIFRLPFLSFNKTDMIILLSAPSNYIRTS